MAQSTTVGYPLFSLKIWYTFSEIHILWERKLKMIAYLVIIMGLNEDVWFLRNTVTKNKNKNKNTHTHTHTHTHTNKQTNNCRRFLFRCRLIWTKLRELEILKGGCAHFDMCKFRSKLIVKPYAFCKIHFAQCYLKVTFYFSPEVKQEGETGDKAVMKIIKSKDLSEFCWKSTYAPK